MRHLYQKIYLTIIASLLLVVVMAGLFWRFGAYDNPLMQAYQMAGELAAAALPPGDAPRALQQEAVKSLAERLDTDIALFDQTLAPIAAAGRPLPPPRRIHDAGGWVYGPDGPAWSLRLPDHRWVVARAPARFRHGPLGLLLGLGAIAGAVAVVAYPVVRGLTRRLERLQVGVETLGAGNLAARVKIEGRDEVARLAESFNRAAGRIEQLVGAHRMLLANASHELRTPLSRIRLGLELFQQNADPKYKAAIEQDVAELDTLVDEILLASRIDATRNLEVEEIDLLALTAEECARYDDCTLQGQAANLRGDSRLLRRLIRNLLENAKNHGKAPIRVDLRSEGQWALLEVADAGSGIPTAEREAVFAPFHRLTGTSQGAGLGLALVRNIARIHGGDAIVSPRPDAASCFRVTLPISAHA